MVHNTVVIKVIMELFFGVCYFFYIQDFFLFQNAFNIPFYLFITDAVDVDVDCYRRRPAFYVFLCLISCMALVPLTYQVVLGGDSATLTT